MARYSIDGQILTDMADAIRNNIGEVKPTTIAGQGQFTITSSSYTYSFGFNQIDGQRYRVSLYCDKTSEPPSDYNQLSIETLTTGNVTCPITTEVQYLYDTYEEGKASGLGRRIQCGFNAPLPVTVYYTIEYVDENNEPMAAVGKDYTPAEMVEFIEELPATPAPIVLTGNQNYGCARSLPAAFITTFPDLVTTKDLTDVGNMFYGSTLSTVPFDINISTSSYYVNMSNMFASSSIRELPNIPFAKPNNMVNLCNYNTRLKEIPEGWSAGWDWSYFHSYNYASGNAMFYYCNGLRRVAPDFLKECWSPYTSSYGHPYYQTFYYCYSLDEVVGLGVSNATLTSNMFSNIVSSCYRLKRFTFDTDENGKAKAANWKGQTIDLTYIVGDANYVYQSYSPEIYPKRVTDDATYQALKDDPDWWTTDAAYCRYNHDSAVETINSLPDTKTYIALNGGTNTIKFRGACGSKTDGGAVSNLTKEEIAVATAKGWTVSIT